MKCVLSIFGLAAGLSLASLANATVTNYTFATSNTQLADGATYCNTFSVSCGAAQTVTVYAKQSQDSNGAFVTPATVTSGPWWAPTTTPTENGLFTVTDSPNNNGQGIAPFDPTEGGSPFSTQDGISDAVPGSTNDNLLLLKLTNFSANSTLSLLLQAGVGGDSFNVYTSLGSTPTGLGGMTEVHANVPVDNMTLKSNGSSQSTTPQVTGLTITGLNSGTVGWIAIQADCHYLLLNSLSVNTPGVPEPRFYGLLLAAFLGLAGIVYNKRRTAQSNA